MSLRAMAWAVGQDVGNPLRKLVLMVLADEHRDDTDLCCPGSRLQNSDRFGAAQEHPS